MMLDAFIALFAVIILLFSYVVSAVEKFISLSPRYLGGGRSAIKPHRRLFYDDDYQKLFKKYAPMSDLPPVVTFDDIKERLRYRPNNCIYRPVYHIGQRKLFNNELQFLTDHLNNKDDRALVVYAGSSPSNHLWYLHTLFPNVIFLLVDPSEAIIHTHDGESHYKYPKPEIVYIKHGDYNVDAYVPYLQNGVVTTIPKRDAVSNSIIDGLKYLLGDHNERIFIYEDLFTVDLAKTISSLAHNEQTTPLYFWSDIRTSLTDSLPTDVDIMWNMAQQYNWVVNMRPTAFMLKFRMPFYTTPKSEFMEAAAQEPYKSDFDMCPIDFVASYDDKKLQYLGGTIYLQCFKGKSSTETRLVGVSTDLIYYDIDDYDNAFFYYNNVERPFCRHKNAFSDPTIGHDLCGDCSLEAHIWQNYRDKFDQTFDVSAAIKHMAIVTRRPLFNDGHGHLYEEFTAKKYEQIAPSYIK